MKADMATCYDLSMCTGLIGDLAVACNAAKMRLEDSEETWETIISIHFPSDNCEVFQDSWENVFFLDKLTAE